MGGSHAGPIPGAMPGAKAGGKACASGGPDHAGGKYPEQK